MEWSCIAVSWFVGERHADRLGLETPQRNVLLDAPE